MHLLQLKASHRDEITEQAAAAAGAFDEYRRGHSVSNDEFTAMVRAKDHELGVSTALLRESEVNCTELEAKLRKMSRENKYLADELQEVRAQ